MNFDRTAQEDDYRLGRTAITATCAGGANASRVEFLQSSIEINLHMETSVSTLLALHA